MSGACFHSRTATNVAISQDGRVVTNWILQFITDETYSGVAALYCNVHHFIQNRVITKTTELSECPFNVLGVIEKLFYTVYNCILTELALIIVTTRLQ